MTERWDESLPRVVGLLTAGLPAGEAWRRAGVLPSSGSTEDAVDRAVVAADALAARLGAPLGAMLHALADVAADVREAESARDAALAGPRLSARVLAWLPAVGIGLGAIVEPATLRLLALTPVGWILLAVGGTLTWAGRAWTHRLVEHAARGGEGQDRVVAVASALIGAALDAGADVPGALIAVGEALEEPELTQRGRAVAASGAWPEPSARWRHVDDALRPAWEAGARAGPALAAVRGAAARRARAAAVSAAGELGVRAALPLTLCLLPAFVLVGLVPLLLAVLGGTSLA